MSGLFVKAGARIINLAHVARVERVHDDAIRLDYAIQCGEIPAGVSFPFSERKPEGNMMEYLQGEAAAAVWDRLTLLARKADQQAGSAAMSLGDAKKTAA